MAGGRRWPTPRQWRTRRSVVVFAALTLAVAIGGTVQAVVTDERSGLLTPVLLVCLAYAELRAWRPEGGEEGAHGLDRQR